MAVERAHGQMATPINVLHACVKFSWYSSNPRKFSTSKILGYTVPHASDAHHCAIHNFIYTIILDACYFALCYKCTAVADLEGGCGTKNAREARANF